MPWLQHLQHSNNLTVAFVMALVFCFVALLVYLVGRIMTERPPREEARLKQISHDSPYNGEPEPGVFGAWAPALAAQIPESEKERRDFQQMLRQAGIYDPRASETIYAVRFLLFLAPLIIAGILCVLMDRKYTLWIAGTGLVVAVILVIVPRFWVYFRRQRHMQRIRDGLADVIDMLGMCVSGGMPISAGLEQVARRMTAYPECANELLLLKRQAELGGIKRALEDFTQRVNLPEASQLASLLLRNTNLGTELVGSLSLQADHLRLARRQAALTEANKTPMKLIFPIMFCFAPAVLILLVGPAIMQLNSELGSFMRHDIRQEMLSNQNQRPSPSEVPTGPVQGPPAGL